MHGNMRYIEMSSAFESRDILEIPIDGKVYNLSRKWLGLISHYEVNLPIQEILKINFVECKKKVLKINCGNLMVFAKPIVLESGFRVIPGFTNYCINKFGEVKDIQSNQICKITTPLNNYPSVPVFDPDKNSRRNVNIHLLLARAFIPNDFKNNDRFFVNHKDGNKNNFVLNNLEWVSSYENNIHAIKHGLRNDNKPCIVKDIETGEESHHCSLANALSFVGSGKTWVSLTKSYRGLAIPRCFYDKYEIKIASEEREWFYGKENPPEKYRRIFRDLQCLNIKTGQVTEFKTVKKMVRFSGVSEDRIYPSILSCGKIKFNGFSFREKTIDPWPNEFIESIFYSSRQITATHTQTGEVKVFSSLRKICKFLDLDKETIKKRLSKAEPLKGWILVENKSVNSPTC